MALDLGEGDLGITRREEHIEFDFSGEFSAAVAMRVVDRMVEACAEAGCSRILLDCRKMRGAVSIVDRFEVAEHGASVMPWSFKIALLVREDQTLPDRFFETVAVSRGVNLHVFTRKDESLGWLSEQG